jgi:hypothetical protein
MELLHFTAAENVSSILVEGLKPAETPRDGLMLEHPHGCVWFTRAEVPTMWWGDPSMYARCIVVVLPASDKRLMSFERWMREHLSPDRLEVVTAAMDDTGFEWRWHYLYFGIVPPHRIRVIAKTEEARA